MADPLLAAFGDRVRSSRTALGLSQEKLGELSRLHRTYVGHVERGEVNPTLISIIRLATALELDPAELVTGLRLAHHPHP